MPTLDSRIIAERQRAETAAINATSSNGLIRRGVTSITTDGDGEATISHGDSYTPLVAFVGLIGDSIYDVQLISIDSTNITVRLRNITTNADVTSTTVNVHWATMRNS
jgi:hypothetical protein